MKDTQTRYYDIDFLRFLAAIAVVLFHYTFRGYSADGLSNIRFDEISFLTKYGYLGVNLFFMISGFVILMTAKSGNFKNFLISRFIRLYPTFWIGMFFTVTIIFIFQSELFKVNMEQILLNLTMIPDAFNEKPIDGVYWTLFIELKFYFLIIILLIFKQIKYIEVYALLWITWSFSFYFFHFPYILNKFLFASFSSYFIAGSMFYLIKYKGISFFRFLIILLTWILSTLYSLKYMERQIEHFGTIFSSFVIIFILTMFYGVFFLISLNKTNFINKRFFMYFGALTYPLYLIHQNAGYILLNYFSQSLNKFFLLFSIIIVMLLISFVIYYYIEKTITPRLKYYMKNDKEKF